MRTLVDSNIFLTYRAKDIHTKMNSFPICVDIDDTASMAKKKLDAGDFDQAPVVSNESVVGWILRKEIMENLAIEETFHRLSHNDLISGDAPLDDALQRLMKQELIFTIGKDGIEGFIVRSDVERHVSRAHMYLLISGLEILMTKNVELQKLDFEILIGFMSPNSRDAWERAKRMNFDANPVEYLDLRGLSKAITLNQPVMNHIGLKKQDWLTYIESLKKILDWVAHSNTEELVNNPFTSTVTILNKTAAIVKRLNTF
jgi:CBS domain